MRVQEVFPLEELITLEDRHTNVLGFVHDGGHFFNSEHILVQQKPSALACDDITCVVTVTWLEEQLDSGLEDVWYNVSQQCFKLEYQL